MKLYYKFITILCGVAVMASCSKLNTMPVFEASESFAAIEKSSASINEDKGQIVIPVTIGSIDPVNTTISYKLVDGTAKAGIDFEDTNPSAVLTFKNDSRTENIVINIIPRIGEYTGDLDFSVELISATGLKLSMEKTCKVVINDIDHPLAAILGSYSVKGYDFFLGDVSYTATLTKDEKDITVVWCDAVAPVQQSQKMLPAYANVTQDEDGNYTLSFPCGQVLGDVGYGNEYLYLITEFDGSTISWDPAGTIVFTQTADGFETTNGILIRDTSFWQGGIILGEESAALGNYKTVWTKID